MSPQLIIVSGDPAQNNNLDTQSHDLIGVYIVSFGSSTQNQENILLTVYLLTPSKNLDFGCKKDVRRTFLLSIKHFGLKSVTRTIDVKILVFDDSSSGRVERLYDTRSTAATIWRLIVLFI